MFLKQKFEAFQAFQAQRFQASQVPQALTLKPRQPVEDEVECWDDDDDLQGIEDLQFRPAPTTAIASSFSNQPSHNRESLSSSNQPSHHRDSISSRLSTRSDVDSNGGGDEDFQVLLPTDDEVSTTTAIASAKSAGIPIPTNVPSSALLGGTIKRLGGRRIKKVLGGDDWGEDLELPKMEDGGLTLKKSDEKDFPEALRQISGAFSQSPSPASSLAGMDPAQSAQPLKPVMTALDKFRDEEGDDEFFGDIATIKVAKSRPTPKTINFIPPPTTTKVAKDVENFENDLEFPSDGEPLRLSTRKEGPKTPPVSQANDDFDTEWAEGSLGTRFGGTKRDGRSNRSSSISALSPSVSSCLTAESEDEGLDGLILPDGPLKFEEALKKRLENASLDVVDPRSEKQVEKPTAPKEDFFAGIDIGDGDVFDSGKLTLNRNIKHKAARQTSPVRRTAMTLTFTNKPQATTTATRIPKPQGHDRVRSKLEPVSESGGPVPSYQRPRSSHSAKSSLSGIPAPSTSSSSNITAPSTPRRSLMSKSSEHGQKVEPTTTGAQLLRSKRSMPVLRGQPSPARSQPLYPRPSSRADHSTRQTIPSRPKTPVDRVGAESSLANTRKPPVPFLPAGTSHAQSHHISIKTTRHLRRPGSSDSNEQGPLNNRPISRLSNVIRSGTPNGSRASSRKDIAPESLAREAASKRHITKPTRRRAFGDGSELEVFDDLPTSATIESKFVKQPIGRGAPKSTFRSRLGQVQIPSQSRTETPAPRSPTKPDFTPRFARDTNASRIAREQRTGAVNAHPLRESASITHLAPLREGTATNIHPPREVGGPLVPLTSTNWKSAIPAKGPPATPSLARNKTRKHAHQPPQKPCLIKPLGDHVNSAKSVNGMHWNPTLFRWEGNEIVLAPFDAPVPAAQLSPKSSPGMKPAPALIANVGATKGVQVVGGMVFDPQRMCWLKMGRGHGTSSNPKSPDSVEEDEEEDPFAGLEDLDEGKSIGGNTEDSKGKNGGGGSGGYGGDDEWLVGEEFDVGPEFVRRQRVEEEKWKRKVDGWTGPGREGGDAWKWAIRDIVAAGLGR